LSDEMTEEDWETHLAKYFPRCPLCGSKSLEFDIEYGRPYDYVHCHSCHAKWEVDWKGQDYAIESIKLVEVRDVDRIGLKGKKHDPGFWLKAASEIKQDQPITKEKEIVREKEVIVKIRCPYCHRVYDETLDTCPHCGASR